jgi:hypothetical protein
MVWWERYDSMPLFIGLLMKFTYPLCVSERQHSLSHLRFVSFPENGVPLVCSVLRLLSPVREIWHLDRDNSLNYPLLSCDFLLFKTSSSNAVCHSVMTSISYFGRKTRRLTANFYLLSYIEHIMSHCILYSRPAKHAALRVFWHGSFELWYLHCPSLATQQQTFLRNIDNVFPAKELLVHSTPSYV